MVLRWNKNSLGYRAISLGSKINRGDRVIMAINLDTKKYPKDGHVYDVK